MANRLKLPGHRSAFVAAPERSHSAAPRRRNATPRVARNRIEPLVADTTLVSNDAANQALQGILQTATDLLGSKRGFLLTCTDAGVMEVACARALRPVEVMDLVLTQAALVIRTVLRERQPVAADALGRAFWFEADAADSRLAAIFCMPLDLGARRTGLFCALRDENAGLVGALDLEILHGLCDQAALVIGASSASTALAHLEACIRRGSMSPPLALV